MLLARGQYGMGKRSKITLEDVQVLDLSRPPGADDLSITDSDSTVVSDIDEDLTPVPGMSVDFAGFRLSRLVGGVDFGWECVNDDD